MAREIKNHERGIILTAPSYLTKVASQKNNSVMKEKD